MANLIDRCEGCDQKVCLSLLNYVYTDIDGGFAAFCYECFVNIRGQLIAQNEDVKVSRMPSYEEKR